MDTNNLCYEVLDYCNEKFENYAFGRNRDNFIFVNGELTEKQLEFTDEEESMDGKVRKDYIAAYVEAILPYFFKKKFMKKIKAYPKVNE